MSKVSPFVFVKASNLAKFLFSIYEKSVLRGENRKAINKTNNINAANDNINDASMAILMTFHNIFNIFTACIKIYLTLYFKIYCGIYKLAPPILAGL
ncbi:hypothetical protein [uncultured Campylobacter sp.]|uniref:hypothetical protein n=1 Tax=uncultured Campylobacter sp. TaxID=218934 RepID=UPI00262D81FB|nr:hypothetical protein [uncultured Campylobacter sp.]